MPLNVGKPQNKKNDRKIIGTSDLSYNDGNYYFKEIKNSKSWEIGLDNEDDYANAVIEGCYKCPNEIIIPRSFSPSHGMDGPVEIIGRHAFDWCGYYGTSVSIFVPNVVKIIKYCAFSNCHSVANFTLEAGSQLTTLEYRSLYAIGFILSRSDPSARLDPCRILTLPSTLVSVAQYGIYQCDLFLRIIYCGTHYLSDFSYALEYKGLTTQVFVVPEYKYKIFGRTSSFDESLDITSICENFTIFFLNYSSNCIPRTYHTRASYHPFIYIFLTCSYIDTKYID